MRNAKLLLGIFVVLCCSGFALGQMAMPAVKTPGDALNAILDIGSGEFTGGHDFLAQVVFEIVKNGIGRVTDKFRVE